MRFGPMAARPGGPSRRHGAMTGTYAAAAMADQRPSPSLEIDP